MLHRRTDVLVCESLTISLEFLPGTGQFYKIELCIRIGESHLAGEGFDKRNLLQQILRADTKHPQAKNKNTILKGDDLK
jgi:hypothetical protein